MHAPIAGSPNSATTTSLAMWARVRNAVVGVVRRHALPLLCAAVVGALSVAPHVLARITIGDASQGIPFLYSDDEDYYLARMREFVDGHWSVGSPFLFEYKNQLTVQAPVPELLFYVLPSTITRIPLPWFLIVADFLLPALLFFLVWRLTSSLAAMFLDKRSAVWAGIVAGMLVTLGYEFLPFSAWVGLLQGVFPPLALSPWVRPVNPITGGVLLFALLNVLWALVRKVTVRRTILAAVIYALMIGYVFSWAIALAVVALLALRAFIWGNRRALGAFAIVAAAGVCAFAVYAWAAVSSTHAIEGAELLGRNGLALTHAPIFNKFLWAATIVFLATTVLSVWKKGLRSWRLVPDWWWFVFVLLLAGHAAYLQQIVTGRTIWYHHFVQYTKPFAFLAVTLGIAWVLRAHPRIRGAVFGVLTAACLVNGLAMASTYPTRLPQYRAWQQDASVFTWLNTNAPKDCVVLVQEATEWRELFIPAFTHCNVYATQYLLMKLPAERIQHIFFIKRRMEGVTPAAFPAWLADHERSIRSLFYDSWDTMFGQGRDAWVEQKMQELIPAYEQFSKIPLADALREYRIDFLLTEQELTPDALLVIGANGPVFTNGQVWLYRMK